MDANTLLLGQVDFAEGILTQGAQDLSESEFLAQLPGPGQHANWIFGHLSTTEDWLLSKLTGSSLELSEDVHSKYKPIPTLSAAASAFVPRSEVLALFKDQRQRTDAAIQGADTATWDNPLPEGIPPQMGNTGGAWGVIGTHVFWHLGQLTAIRRMLGKPALFS